MYILLCARAAQGLCEGLTYEEIKSNYPHELSARDIDKFRYAFPMGEVCSLTLTHNHTHNHTHTLTHNHTHSHSRTHVMGMSA